MHEFQFLLELCICKFCTLEKSVSNEVVLYDTPDTTPDSEDASLATWALPILQHRHHLVVDWMPFCRVKGNLKAFKWLSD